MTPKVSADVQRARQLTAEILLITESLDLARVPEKDEDDVARYEAMVKMREPLVQALSGLSLDEAARASDAYLPVVDNIKKIAKLEKQNIAFFSQMQDTIKEAYKLVKQGQRIYKGYQAVPSEGMPSRFDIKQ